MAFPVLETPRTELADQTRLSNHIDLDNTTHNSIPSPSKDSNDLLNQIRGMRGQQGRSPRSRVPLAERRMVPNKNEFTPLLKSATRNRMAQSTNFEKENVQVHTPAALKANYIGASSPPLPINSSVFEEHTGSSVGDQAREETPAMPVSSSSAVSTPMAILPHRGEGPLDNGRNLATLREQEARLEQIDKENFSLKLKIHFMEEALRRNGKEFNEAAIKENTELKVDKVTLQRDLKHYRKCLAQAEKDLEEYKKQLLDYAEKVKRRHANEGMQQELDQLRQAVAEKEAEIENLQRRLEASEQQNTTAEQLRDQIGDLEDDLREKDRIIDGQDEELESLREKVSSSNDNDQLLQQRDDLLAERDDDIQGLQDALQAAHAETERRLKEKDRLLEEKDDELRELEEQVKLTDQEDASMLRAKAVEEVQKKDAMIEELRNQLRDAEEKADECDELRRRLSVAEQNLETAQLENDRELQNKDEKLHSLEQKLQSQENHNLETGKQSGLIDDLEADKRDLERQVEDKEDELDQKNLEMNELRNQISQLESVEQELIEAKGHVEDLETKHERNVKEIQSLRDAANSPSRNGQHPHQLRSAEEKVRQLEDLQDSNRVRERQIQHELNQLRGELDRARQTLEENEAALLSQRKTWGDERDDLQSANNVAEKRIADLQSTIRQLQEAEGTLSGRELQLQKSLDEEKQRHEKEEALLKEAMEASKTSYDRQGEALEETKSQLLRVQQEVESSQAQENALQERIQSLEDEIEVLESGVDEDVNRLTDEITAAKQESDGLRRQIRGLQQDLAKTQNDLTTMQNEAEILRAAQSQVTQASSPKNRELKSLQDQLSQVRKERQSLQEQLIDREADAADAKAELVTLQQDLKSSSGSREQFQQKLREMQDQFAKSRREKQDLQDELALATADLEALQTSVSDLENGRDAMQKQLTEVKSQLHTAHRDAERKAHDRISSLETEIRDLEQDIQKEQSKQQDLIGTNKIAEQTISGLKNKVLRLEQDLIAVRASKTHRDTSFEERKDLHEMLKQAKLEVEELRSTVHEREITIDVASKKESELRTQLKRTRGERADQTDRANVILKEFESLQAEQSRLVGELAVLRESSRQVHFTKDAAPTDGQSDVMEIAERRHAAEIRGLAKQIEYLTARCHREEAFRSDLGFIKTYFTKQVEMYTRCNKADMKLIKSMGIRTDTIIKDMEAEAAFKVGRVEIESRKGGPSILKRTRPSLKTVALMVVASVRMKRTAEKWRTVTNSHALLLDKLKSLQRNRAVGQAARKEAGEEQVLKRKKSRSSLDKSSASQRKHSSRRALREANK